MLKVRYFSQDEDEYNVVNFCLFFFLGILSLFSPISITFQMIRSNTFIHAGMRLREIKQLMIICDWVSVRARAGQPLKYL